MLKNIILFMCLCVCVSSPIICLFCIIPQLCVTYVLNLKLHISRMHKASVIIHLVSSSPQLPPQKKRYSPDENKWKKKNYYGKYKYNIYISIIIQEETNRQRKKLKRIKRKADAAPEEHESSEEEVFIFFFPYRVFCSQRQR